MRIISVFEKTLNDNSSVKNLTDNIYYNIENALKKETDPNTLFLFVDSEYEYSDTFLEKILEKWNKNQDCAIGSAGYKKSKVPGIYTEYHNYPTKGSPVSHEGEIVDYFYFYPGVLIQRKFLDDNLKNFKDVDKYLNDNKIVKKVFRLPRVYGNTPEKNIKKIVGTLLLICAIGGYAYFNRI